MSSSQLQDCIIPLLFTHSISQCFVLQILSDLGPFHSGEVNDGETKASRKSSKKDNREGKDKKKSRKDKKQDSDATRSPIQHAARDEGRQHAIHQVSLCSHSYLTLVHFI